MSDGPLLVLAATRMELAPLLEAAGASLAGPWPASRATRLAGRAVVLAETGIGTAAAAAATGLLAERHAPRACLLLGIAGAYPGASVPIGAAACAAEEAFLDAGVLAGGGIRSLASVPLPLVPGADPVFERVPVDPAWTARLAAACGRPPLPFGTSDGLSGDAATATARAARAGVALESMEGAAVALACLRLGLPFAEVRGVSNEAGVRDKGAWEIPAAVAAAGAALLRALRDGA